MSKAKLYSSDGEFKSDIDLPGSYFDQPVHEAALYNFVTVHLNNQRQGTAKTKSRSEVSGGTKKPWRQKGTGRARAGSNTSPVWTRGGKAHGAQPRQYNGKLNKKVKAIALKSALSLKAKQSCVHVFESFSISQPKTRELSAILKKASLSGCKNLIVVTEADSNLMLASRNIPATRVDRLQEMNVYEILKHNNLIFTQSSVAALTERKREVQ